MMHMASELLNSCHGTAMAEWCGGFFANRHRQFVKGGPQWRAYMAKFWPSAMLGL